MIRLQEDQLRQMLSTAAEIGAKKALREAGLDKTHITKAEAYRRFSRKRIDGWISRGIIVPTKNGSSVLLNANNLDAIAQTNHLCSKNLLNLNTA